jgi:hypothetical protein
MSHDTDGNDAAKGRRLLEVVNAAQIHTTWCTIMPGYPADLVSAIREGGHELAMHYDSMTEGLPWSEALFEKQFRALTEMFGGASIVTNKNHYLRWEGDCELFDWCAKRGIELDQSKGASKTGEAGFNFGTCHPYLPVRLNGQTIDVLELATPTQDIHVFAPETLVDPLLDAAVKHHGIMHLLYHPAHVMTANVADSIMRSVEKAKKRGLEWWTGKQINEWERARRGLSWAGCDASGSTSASFKTSAALPDATLLWLAPSGMASIAGVKGDSRKTDFWGFSFVSTTASLEANAEYTLHLATS